MADEKVLETDSICPTCEHSMVMLVATNRPVVNRLTGKPELKLFEDLQVVCHRFGSVVIGTQSVVQGCTEYAPGGAKSFCQPGGHEVPKKFM